MSDRTFILGVGAPRCGTTWLHYYLSSFAKVDVGAFKEYHVWDAITIPILANYRLKSKKETTDEREILRWKMQNSEDFYFDYFTHLIDGERIKISGDITPSYSALSSRTLEKIICGFEVRGIRVKIVFLMRDPVERCWSAVRTQRRSAKSAMRRRRLLKYYFLSQDEDLRRECKKENCRIRTRYDQTVAQIEKIASKEKIYYGIYESMFNFENLSALSKFLSVPPRAELVERRKNKTRKTRAISKQTKAFVAEEYRAVYEFCGSRFPETKALWQGFQSLSIVR